MSRLRRFGRFAMLGPRGSGERIFTVRCERGAEIARMIGFSERVPDAIRAMDEHWDGGGYPYGLRRDSVAALRADHRPRPGHGDLLGRRRSDARAGGGARAERPLVRSRSGRRAGRSRSATARSGTRLGTARLDHDVLAHVPAELEIAADDDAPRPDRRRLRAHHRRQVAVHVRSFASRRDLRARDQRASR